jgi:CPA1 family monovalent cation:H+ antiporter
MNTEATFIILFSIATGIALLVRNFRVPYTVALVLTGLILGATGVMTPPHLTRELLFAIFLPGLLFDAAFNIEAREFWHNRFTIGALAVPGVLAGIVLTGVIVTTAITGADLVQGFAWQHGLVFGALVAATDPIAVVALFRELHAPARLRLLVEGESLLNDGTSIVALTLILAYVGGSSASAGDLFVQFVTIVGGGVMIGGALGFILSRLIARVDDAMIEITLTTIAAYGSFVVAEQMHFSGVIATVTAGLICGNYARPVGMSPSTQMAVQTFWEYVAFALNSVIFLLIGFEVSFKGLLESWQLIIIAFTAVIAARAVIIFGISALLRRSRESISYSWSAAITWSGLRGALSMVLALALASSFPGRELLIRMTFGVVLLSILVQGLTMPAVLRRLGITIAGSSQNDYHFARGDLQVSSNMLDEVERVRRSHVVPDDLLDSIAEGYRKRRSEAQSELLAMHASRDELRQSAAVSAVEHMLRVEKLEILSRLRSGLMARDVFDKLSASVDERLVRIRKGENLDIESVTAMTDHNEKK